MYSQEVFNEHEHIGGVMSAKPWKNSFENVEWEKISTNINSVATVFEELKDNFKEHQEKFNGYKKEVIKLEKREKQEKLGDVVVKKEEVGGKEGKEGRSRA